MIILLFLSFHNAFQHPVGFHPHTAVAVKNAKMLRTTAEGVVVPYKGGNATLHGLANQEATVVRHVLVDKVCLTGFLAVSHAPFAHHQSKTFVTPGADNLVEEFSHSLFIAGRCLTLVLIGLAPVVVLTLSGIVPRCVVVELYAHIVVAIPLYIVRNDEIAIVEAKVGITHIGLDDEVTLQVVTTRGTYDIDKCLVV